MEEAAVEARADSTRMLDALVVPRTSLSQCNRTMVVDRVAIHNSSMEIIKEISQIINIKDRRITSSTETITMVRHAKEPGIIIRLRTSRKINSVREIPLTAATITMVINNNRTITRDPLSTKIKSSNVQGKTTNREPTRVNSTKTRNKTTIEAERLIEVVTTTPGIKANREAIT